jgi:hypothetical protein
MHPTRNLAWMCALAVALAAFLPTPNSPAAELKTSKERLSNKAADEQRVDNCRVPADRRGTVARPDCAAEAETLPSGGPNSARDGSNQGERNRGGFR